MKVGVNGTPERFINNILCIYTFYKLDSARGFASIVFMETFSVASMENNVWEKRAYV